MQFINNFRGIAILLVIFIHAISTVRVSDSFVIESLKLLLDNCTVLFVVVAGYLFNFQIETFNYKRFMHSKFYAVIIPYIVLSIPAILLYLLHLKANHWWIDMAWFNTLNPFFQYFYLMVTGAHLGPLWFIPMIILLYIASPLVIFCVNRNILPVVFVICSVIAFYVGRPEFNENNIQSSLYFLPPYLLGIILARSKGVFISFNRFSHVVLASFILLYLLLVTSIQLSTSVDLLFKMVFAIIVLSVTYRFLQSKNIVLDMFARLSFFLFFIHGYFTGVFRVAHRVFNVEYNSSLYVLFIFGTVVLLSISTFIILKLCFKENNSKKWIGI